MDKSQYDEFKFIREETRFLHQLQSFIGGPEAGLQFYVEPKTFIEAMLEYQIPFEDADEADLVYSLGIGFNF